MNMENLNKEILKKEEKIREYTEIIMESDALSLDVDLVLSELKIPPDTIPIKEKEEYRLKLARGLAENIVDRLMKSK